jgi:tetratricopeptide (TPR) repeat protein
LQRRTDTEKLSPMILLRFLAVSSLLALSAACSSGGPRHLDSSLIHNGRPTEAEAYSDFLIARFAAMTNDPQKAAEHYALAIDTAPEKSGIADRALFASLLSGDYREGVRLARRANTLGSEAALVRLTLAVEALRIGRDDDARQMLEHTRFGPFNRMVARGLSAWRVVDTQGTDAAVRYLEDGLSGDPRLDSATLYMMGLIEMSAGNDDAALSVFDTLWDTSARLAIGVEAHAQLLASRGQRERALEILNAFDEEVGHNASIARLREAIEAGEKIKVRRLSPDEGAALAIYVPAAALMSRTSDDVSAVYFVLALALDPDLHVARSLWAQSLSNAERWDEAIGVLSRVPETSAFYATSRGQIAWALQRSGRSQSALAVAAEALKHSPDRGLKVQIAELYRAVGRQKQAEALLSEIIREDARSPREDWRLFYARGVARGELGDWSEGERDLLRALALQPDDASLLNYVGYSYVDRGEHLDLAMDMIRRAAEMEPNAGYIIDSLGWAHYRLGNYETAAAHLERAVELEPGDPVLNDHLGDAYWQTGRKLEARFQWRRSLTLDPTDGERDRIEAKLVAGPSLPLVKQAESGAGTQLPEPVRP